MKNHDLIFQIKLSFLEEKKAKVKDAIDKLGETEELTEAMNLLEEEISKFEKSLQETYDKVVLGGNKGDKSKTHDGEDFEEEDEKKEEAVTEKKSRNEYLDDGFVEAEITKNGNGLKRGMEVMVSAEDYTSLGDDDQLEVIDPKTGKATICPKSQLSVKI